MILKDIMKIKKGYIKYTIGEVALEIKTGKTPPSQEDVYYTNGNINWYTPTDIGGESILYYSSKRITQTAIDKKVAFVYKPNTVLITCIGEIGRVGIVANFSASNQQITGVYTNESLVSHKFFYYWLVRNRNLLKHYSNYSIIPILNNGILEKIPIYLPNLDTQHKAISQLDLIQSLIDKRKKTIEIIDELIKCTFSDMFGIIKDDWTTCILDDVISQTQYGLSKSLTTEPTEFPILRMNNITYNGEIDLNDIKWIKLTQKEKTQYKLDKGDILFNRTNSRDLVGKTAVWDHEEDFYFAGYLVRIKVKETVNPYFISGFLNSEYGKKMLFNYARSSGSQSNFSPTLLRKQDVFLPPIESQNKYEEIIKKLKNQKHQSQKSLDILDNLFKSILQDVFNEKEIINEEDLFIDLARTYTKADYLSDNKRIANLMNALNNNQFNDVETYKNAKNIVFELLKDDVIRQLYNTEKQKMELNFSIK